MMLPSLAFALLGVQNPTVGSPAVSSPTDQPARLVGASLFKNGFSITQRVIEIPKTGSTTVLPVPQGAMGTLWFTPSEGMTLDSVAVENETLPSTQQVSAGTVDEILALNVGGVVTLLLYEKANEAPIRITGKLITAAGNIVVVETAETTKVLTKGSIIGVEGKGLKSQSSVTGGTSRRVMRVRTSGRAGRVTVVALERNLTWVPAYALNLLPGGKELTLTAKATIINDLEKMTDLDCRFITGFPNLPFAEAIDPLLQWHGNPGAFTRQDGSAFQNQAPSPESRRGGNAGFTPQDEALLSAAAAPDGNYLEELFFYRRSGVSVDVGGRAAYTLFQTTTPYESIYAWNLTDPLSGQARFEPRILPPGVPSGEEIWQTLRFLNNAKVPLTTAPATTFSEGEIVGQDTLKYVSPGQTAELRVTRTLDVSADFSEEEVGRERGFVKQKVKDVERFVYDRITVRGTLSLINRKSKAIKMRIRKPFTGEWMSGDGKPQVKTTAAGLRQPNPTGNAEWTATVEPGASLTLTYTTRMLVASRSGD